jgi:hypothetical protein
MLKSTHCLDNRLTDFGKVVSLTHKPRSTPRKHYFSASGTHFCYRLNKPWSLVRPEGLSKLKTFIHLIGSRILDLPACSIFPSRLCYRVHKKRNKTELTPYSPLKVDSHFGGTCLIPSSCSMNEPSKKPA